MNKKLMVTLLSIFALLAHATDEVGKKPHNPPILTTSAIIEVYEGEEFQGIVLIEGAKAPWGIAIPGGKVEYGETVENSIRREIWEEVQLELQDLKQFHVYSDPSRDFCHHSIEVTHIAKAFQKPHAGDEGAQVFLVKLEEIPWNQLAFDHAQILRDYIEWKMKNGELGSIELQFVKDAFPLIESDSIVEEEELTIAEVEPVQDALYPLESGSVFEEAELATLEMQHSQDFFPPTDEVASAMDTYFKNFETLAKTENWPEIISQGASALTEAKALGKKEEEAKICAQLASTAFYQGDYLKALEYANCCHQLSEQFQDCSLLVRALYLQSAVHRALARTTNCKISEQLLYSHAIKIAQEALRVYEENGLDNPNLKGKIYFNLGAAEADNPRGDLSQASIHYFRAWGCFQSAHAIDDVIATQIRLGKVYLLQEEPATVEQIIREVRSYASSERLNMQIDSLESQLKFAIGDDLSAIEIAKIGMDRAEKLGAKEDLRHFSLLLQANSPGLHLHPSI
jgi:8-oxo-dGTP diphosphatase